MIYTRIRHEFHADRSVVWSPRRQRCLEATDRDLGDALGKAFVQQTFSREDKSKVLEMVAALQAAMGEDIASLTWMSAATKQQAIIKLRALEVK